MGATFLDADGEEQPMEMGCYGIGVTRTAAAAIEQNHDDNGIIWPLALAPAQVHLIAGEPPRTRRSATAAERALRASCRRAGVEVLLDDRDERPGVKFKDADLIGIPLRVTVGPKALARGAVEFKPRRDRAGRRTCRSPMRSSGSPRWCATGCHAMSVLLAPRRAAAGRCAAG